MARSLKVVFRSNVEKIAKAGDVKEVSPGYARNFLFPRGLAFPANPAAMRQWETERQGTLAKQTRQREIAQGLAQQLESATCTIATKAGPQGRLFGAIGSREILAALAQQGIQLEKRALQLKEPIKHIGNVQIPVRLGPDIQVQLKVQVTSQSIP
jgi:large subunit ribosomal protein L9